MDPTPFPLFGGSDLAISWSTFASQMGKFSVGTTEEWCQKCGNSTGVCAAASSGSGNGGSGSGSSGSSTSGDGMSRTVAGVIGAFVTLGVILGLEALVLLLGGLRLVSKKRLQGAGSPVGNGNGVKA